MKFNKSNQLTNDNSMISVSKHLAYIFMESLLDVLGYKKKRIEKFMENMEIYREAYFAKDITSVDIMKWGQDKEVFVLARIKEIPMKDKLKFGDIKGKNGNIAGIDRNIESIMLVDITIACMILKEQFKESYAKIKEFLAKVIYLVDSYVRLQPKTKITYLNDNMIRELMIDEVGYDFSFNPRDKYRLKEV